MQTPCQFPSFDAAWAWANANLPGWEASLLVRKIAPGVFVLARPEIC